MDGSKVDHNYIRQIKEPSVAKGSYPTNFQGVQDAFTTFFPEALGYLVGYGFTGLGDPTQKSKWSKDMIGIEGGKKRVLGANYFVNSKVQCSPKSVANCVQHDRYDYVRTYPLFGYGAISGSADDLLEFNPITLSNVLIGRNNFSDKCQEVTLPVGNNFLDSKFKFASQEDFEKQRDDCLSKCQTDDRNCQRFCRRGWWEETRCSANPVGVRVKYDDKAYTIPHGTGDIKELGESTKAFFDDLSARIKSKDHFNNYSDSTTTTNTEWFIQQGLLCGISLVILLLLYKQQR